MQLHELADEFALTADAAADLCARIGLPAAAPGDAVSPADAERFRSAARAELDQAPAPDVLRPDDVVAGWAAPPTGAPVPMAGPTAGAGTDHPASWMQSADRARLDAARARGRALVNQGLALLALGLVITVGTLALAPGGFFIVSFGTVFVGFRRIRAGRMIQAQVRQAEQQLGP